MSWDQELSFRVPLHFANVINQRIAANSLTLGERERAVGVCGIGGVGEARPAAEAEASSQLRT